ncbi:MAG: calcium/sodium antiporter [Thermodesulfobacteriota bacterium]
MDIIKNILFFMLGLAFLYFGGEGLVKGSSRLARSRGINPIVIGLTIVAFGTSAPEFMVSIVAALRGSSDLVIGNIVGSNIANIGLILAISALISPLMIQMTLLKIEVPIMIILSIILYVLAFNLTIGLFEGMLILLCLTAFVIYSSISAFKESRIVASEYQEFLGKDNSFLKNSLFIVLGITALIIGARLVVNSSMFMAREVGISELVIGITAVAVGTSLPELSTSIVAAYRKEHDIVVGNIIGSNIFNIGILGFVSIIHPIDVNSSVLKYELPVMILFALSAIPIMKTGSKVSRLEGILLLLFYSLFVIFLFRNT